MKKKKAIRTLIEIDEVFQNVEPGHFFVVRIFGIPIARFNHGISKKMMKRNRIINN